VTKLPFPLPLTLLSLVTCISCAICPLGGCDQSSNSTNPAAQSKLKVLATVYPMADLARRVAGEHAEVQWLVESGQTLDGLGISPADLRDRAARSRIVVSSGPADVWAQQGMGMDARTARLVLPQTTTAARELYGGGNPDPQASLWLDPKTAIEVAELFKERLFAADPSHEQAFKTNAGAVVQSLQELDAEMRKRLAGLPSRKLLTVRPVWDAFCRRYGLEQVAPVQSKEERLTEDEYRALKAAREGGITTVFVDVSTPAAVRHQIAERTGLNVLTLDTLGSSAPDGRSTYEKVMRYNLEQIVKGLSGKDAK
jgi:ABC-type Zn uptake system ZnuABC Zn-binding protein ZnuA